MPSAVIPDNTRTAVIAADPYEPGLNPVFDEFARHYGLVIVPARVRKARDKALVENAVRLVYQRISARLRGKVFFSLAELNASIRELLEEHNHRPLSRLKISRRQLFEQIEREALNPLRAEALPPQTDRLRHRATQLPRGTARGPALLQRSPLPAPA